MAGYRCGDLHVDARVGFEEVKRFHHCREMPGLLRAGGDHLDRSVEREGDEIDERSECLEKRSGKQVAGRRHGDFESLLSGRLDELPDIRTLEGVTAREDDAPCCTGGDPGDDGERGFGVNWVNTLGTPAVGALLAALRRHVEVERLDASHHNPFRRRINTTSIAKPRTQGSRRSIWRPQPAQRRCSGQTIRAAAFDGRQSVQSRIRPSRAVEIPTMSPGSTLSGVSVGAWKSVSSISSTYSVVNASAGRPCMANIA